MLILNPGIIFGFASVKMDTMPQKRAKIVALNEHTSMTVRDIASVASVRKSSVSRISRIPNHFLQTGKGNAEENEKATSY
jgi:hypothetical protein